MSREDTYIRHQVELAKLTKGELAELLKRFKALQTSIVRNLHGHGKLSTWSKARVEAQIAMIDNIIASWYVETQGEVLASNTTLAQLEAEWNYATMTAMTDITMAPITGSAVMQAVTTEPFQGATYAKWWDGLSRSLRDRTAAEIRMAWATGETLRDVENRLAPVLNRANQNTASVVRSGIMDIAAEARNQTYQANSDVIWAEVWTSTLDARTSLPCRMRDGLAYTIDGKPIGHEVPYGSGPGRIHWGCRSTSVPVMKGEKPEDIIAEFSRPSFDYNQTTTTRAASTLRYDAEEHRPVKKGARRPSAQRRGQPVRTKSRYPEWFKRQPAWVQDKVMGKRKGALYRKGELKLSAFSEDGVKALTIKQLEQRGYEL